MMQKMKKALIIGLSFSLIAGVVSVVFVPSSLAGNCAKCIGRNCVPDLSSGYVGCSTDCGTGTCYCYNTYPTCTSPP